MPIIGPLCLALRAILISFVNSERVPVDSTIRRRNSFVPCIRGTDRGRLIYQSNYEISDSGSFTTPNRARIFRRDRKISSLTIDSFIYFGK